MILYHWIVNFLFPPKCILCRKVLKTQETDLCGCCRADAPEYSAAKRKLQFLDSFVAVWYYEKYVRSSLLRYKFGRARFLAEPYGRLLAMKLLTGLPFTEIAVEVITGSCLVSGTKSGRGVTAGTGVGVGITGAGVGEEKGALRVSDARAVPSGASMPA